MLKLEYDKQEILEVIDKIVKRTMKMDLTWDWPCGVAYFGIADAYEKTGNEEYLKLLKDRVDELIDLGLPKVWTVNACAMGHCLITIYKATGEQKYWDIVMSKINYIRKDALRFGDNVLQHTVSANNDFPEQCWADTLFMAAFFLLRVGVELADEEIIGDALNQYYWHIKYLQDPDSGLYYHGYDNIAKDHMSGFYWGRANAWAAFTMSQVGDILPKCYLYPKYMDVAGTSSCPRSNSSRRRTVCGGRYWMTRVPMRRSRLRRGSRRRWSRGQIPCTRNISTSRSGECSRMSVRTEGCGTCPEEQR